MTVLKTVLASVTSLASLAPVAPLASLTAVTTVTAVTAVAAVTAMACIGSGSVPDPRLAAEAYASAAERGDADAIYSMLTKRSRATTPKSDVNRSIAATRPELADQAKGIRQSVGGTVTIARLRLEDGGEAALTLKDRRFWIASAGVLPGGGSTPEEALGALREAIRRRSYPSLVRLLSPRARAAVEAQLRGLAEALESPGAIPAPTSSTDDVEVKLSNGHKVRLRREQGTWYVENFE